MSDNQYNDPKLAISKVYTKTGDKGRTALVGGQRVPKNHARIETYGTVDELNAFVGSAVVSASAEMPDGEQRAWFVDVLIRVQHELFNLGSILATLPEDVHPKQPRVQDADIEQLEADIDVCNASLPILRSFVLPGGSRTNTDLHVCRTVCRRAERMLISASDEEDIPNEAIRYLNRLSDAFFVWSRWVIGVLERRETLWEPNRAASAQ